MTSFGKKESWVAVWAALLAGLMLRVWFCWHNPAVNGDALVYGAIARNWLQHGVYGRLPAEPTLIRLPGYPLFLAGCFRVFGVDRYWPVLALQVVFDLLSCLLVAGIARRVIGERAERWALWIACLCPFTACYTAAPLTETLELFSTSLAMYAFVRGLGLGPTGRATRIDGRWMAVCVAGWTYAALLRPDGALLAVTLAGAIVPYGWRAGLGAKALRVVALGTLCSLLAFVPWAWRNWHTFHVWEPLAPRYATDPGEPIHPGFQRWTKTVCADFACTSEVYWNADDDVIDIHALPSRAFDSPEQYRETAALLADYNKQTTVTPEMDARFAALAKQRIQTHPVRSLFGMPLLRLTDMWLRPRIELFNIDLRWWHYRSEGPDTILAYALGALNVFYLTLAAWGAWRWRGSLLWVCVAFILLRCALLATIEAPETRYTLECFPMLILLGSAAFRSHRRI